MSVEHHGALPASFRLQEYRIERVLGFGGFGITYLATDTHLNKLVAIKEYLPAALALRTADASILPSAREYAEDFRWGLERFVNEARALARFRHANLVPVLRYFEANGTAYVVMEYERGERLDQFLKRHPGGLPQPLVMQVLAGLLDGLEAVHRAGYLHRDVKPSNIVMRADGTPVLLDFGAARQALGQRSLTMTAIVTPGYAPLEQYSGEGKQGPWTDLYAVGALAHRLIVGAPPVEATARARTDPYRPLVQRQPSGYDAALLRAIDWALQVDEHDRPQSVREFRRVLLGEEVPARNAIVMAAQPRRGRIVPRVLAALSVLVLLAGGGAYTWRQHQLEQEEVAREQQRVQAEQERRQVEERLRVEAERRQAVLRALQAEEQERAAKAAAERAAVERAAAEKAALEKSIADKAAADRAAAEKAAADKPVTASSAMTAQRAAVLARDAANKAREIATQARRHAELGRQKAEQARVQAEAARQAATEAGATRLDLGGGASYRGEVQANRRHGLGVTTSPEGIRYAGQWRNGSANGVGVSHDDQTGNHFEGEWMSGKRQGHGVFTWGDGLRHEGEMQNNLRTGLAVSYASNGSSVEARLLDSNPDGFVVVHDGKGGRYEGNMVKGVFTGFAVMTFADGDRYEGEFRDNKRSGYGILYLPGGSSRSGLWRDNLLVKPD